MEIHSSLVGHHVFDLCSRHHRVHATVSRQKSDEGNDAPRAEVQNIIAKIDH